ncbi:hypothetical protein [Mesorhizobium sp.]|uniref:hypothetical protein n=1 Tax=Mesorhizobium sp. TaxID=1871066 RepID=UPI000FE6B137|nr:hypothetical protein [Mesorhizobium sp.]RWH32482.1 MAG: hypothetical protein EOQ76_03145 [Mesorhizobium sp.]RWH41197.1 MAG: hypothetical protein EOQ79_02175 [Mesorhizobium sp.]TIM67623.1 MAG: hypothetical protein E5Y52_11110 [Mesorhizobium sp.]TIQ93046.1 MAG: hypothetical protein E5X36_31565 [Mesorhizobium sp.]TIR61852.1 MAG: hypothetical protein E5X22_03445 [Mesorhizobium sp.]
MSEAQPLIRVIGFKTSYEKLPVKGDPVREKCDTKGYKLDASNRRILELQPEDWVTYSPSHSPLNTRTTERVRHLLPDPSLMGEDQDGEKLRFMTARWSQIGSAYEAFKAGREIPLNGTALAAWSGVTPEQAEVLRTAGIRTVEEVRDLPDGQLDRVRLPNMRDLRKQAGLFLANSDAAKAAEREAAKDAQIAELVERQAAMEAMIDELTKPKGKGKEAA